MKKTIVLFAFAIASLAFVSCKEEAKEEIPTEVATEVPTEQASEMHVASYACPMDCEKGKMYDAPGKCPVCEMDLVENHEGHNH